MNPALIEPVLDLALELLGKATTPNSQVGKIIAITEAWLPVITEALPGIAAKAQTVVELLQGNATLTAEQQERVQAMSDASDAAFDAAEAEALKEV